jgi:DMSO/TMAO reductase YedYZ molybdopterin-dependent catalytic subunit
MSRIDRRSWLKGAAAAGGGLVAAACDRLTLNPTVQQTLARAEGLTRRTQRALFPRMALAPEFSTEDISPDFRANGTISPQDPAYVALREAGFSDYRLVVDGLVERPLALSLADLRALPARSQITRHDCVEGWSSIGKWTGARLSAVLEAAGLKEGARFIVFHCADKLEPTVDERGRYYESLDLEDAFHEQTILAYEMNDAPLPVAHGAPVRLRVERQLGYKHAKYVMRIKAVESLTPIRGRLLGRPRLRVVCGDLEGRVDPTARSAGAPVLLEAVDHPLAVPQFGAAVVGPLVQQVEGQAPRLGQRGLGQNLHVGNLILVLIEVADEGHWRSPRSGGSARLGGAASFPSAGS